MNTDRAAMAVRSDARAAGMVTAHTTRVTAPWATMRTNCRGYAETDEGRDFASRGIASVRVFYADGTETTRSVHSFRKGSDASRVTKAKAQVQSHAQHDIALQASMGTIHDPNDSN